ncbi:MAG: hypothetical protein ACK5MR_15285 [Cumulibacter sp.]
MIEALPQDRCCLRVIASELEAWRTAMTTLGSERAGETISQRLGFQRELEHLVEELRAAGRLRAAGPHLVSLWIDVLKLKVNGQRVVEELRRGGSADGLLGIDKLNWSELPRPVWARVRKAARNARSAALG